ncbi:MAG: LacI family transcriptional regulator [Clostridiales bacterium]|nr:LacI family transcriptional regulator [Clostridiales bacterium]
MKNNELEIISKITGSSKSAVSKAVNHCFGVDRENRERILSAARQNLLAQYQGGDDQQGCDVYAILPDLPHFFWENILKRLLSLRDRVKCKFNVYSRDSSFVLGEYLREAEELGAKLILIAINPDEPQHELLKHYSEKIPIIFLIERVDIPNTFYVGSNPYDDGAAVRTRARLSDCSKVLIIDDGSMSSRERVRGFLAEGGGLDVLYVHISDELAPASIIAREISALLDDRTDIDLIYSCAGQIRETAIAAVKLNLRGKTLVAGHDFYDRKTFEAQDSGSICGLEFISINQDIDRICSTTVNAIENYIYRKLFPDSKNICIPSI